MTDLSLPRNMKAEEAVLGSILVNNQKLEIKKNPLSNEPGRKKTKTGNGLDETEEAKKR